jgi:hypothetical protein
VAETTGFNNQSWLDNDGRPDTDLLEYVCNENNEDLPPLVGK